MRRTFVLCAFIVGCKLPGPAEENDQIIEEETWARAPYFDPAPHCPAPNSPFAQSYAEHGGSTHAWLWWLLWKQNENNNYREVHHVYQPGPAFYAPPRHATGLLSASRASQAPQTKKITKLRPVVFKSPPSSRPAPVPKASRYGFRSPSPTRVSISRGR